MATWKKPKLTKEQWRLAVLGGLFGVLAVWVYFSMLVVPSFQRMGKLSKEVAQAKEQLAMLTRILANEERIRDQHEHLNETVGALRKLLPAEEQLPQIIEKLSEMALAADVRIQTIFPKLDVSEMASARDGHVDGQEAVSRKIPIQIDAIGGYHSIGMFMSLVENQTIPIEVVTLRISQDSKEFGEHKMHLVLNVFFATAVSSEPERTG